ncbi:MAG: preprotein translocase subunit SecA [Alphaproteobacteria bacterium CG_4_10_14_0_8_um_filter_37_21]|nr:MAG: preprotein translocase subunit SecA [Alphaproteobacteria bacterium CG_4_10_14_0_8_um_filter_37_21]
MLANIIKKIIGSNNDRLLKKNQKIVDQINGYEPALEALSDNDLKAKTYEFKDRLNAGETLEDLLPEAFAVVREASKRVFKMRHFDVQMHGGIALHQGTLIEMKTGEGKTLVATLPVYLNALTEKGVHLVTVNDYLAKRDAITMGKLYEFLGLSTGYIIHGLNDDVRRTQYASDVTYGTNHEFGFDLLRDNMKFRLSDMVMRPFNFAIVDEVDSILIDEARTPLIISGAAEDSSELYKSVNDLMSIVTADDFEKDEKQRNITLTESGIEKLEKELFARKIAQGESLYDMQNVGLVHHVNAALKAHKIFTCDTDYIVKDGKVIIIDEFTGRMMDGRRYSDGLHQAIEAKEGVNIEQENQTLASITYQNFFRMYPKLSGMSGTVITEADEFEEIYKLRAIEVPTNVPVIRLDSDDEVYLTAGEKYKAIIKQVKECYDRKQPVLVGTVSIERSEFLANLLKKEKIPHKVLNARYHEQEALIIGEAGAPGAITIATNMAGRGTDIKLGGNLEMRIERETADMEDGADKNNLIKDITADNQIKHQEALAAGGLFVIGTERHESRRIDNQLRGRTGRQGDPGASKFFISLEDDLMRIFGSDNMANLLRKMGAKEGEVISHSWMNKALARAQQKVEARNFDMRKHLLKYDDVMNDQRKVIYGQRRDIMGSDDISEEVSELYEDVLTAVVDTSLPPETLPDLWDLKTFHEEVRRIFQLDMPVQQWVETDGLSQREIFVRIENEFKEHMDAKERTMGADMLRRIEKDTLLRVLDSQWKNHLLALDHLRQGINLRAYAQGNPLNEYKREAFALFQTMMLGLKEEFTVTMSHIHAAPHASYEDIESALLPEIDFSKLAELTPGVTDSKFNEEELSRSIENLKSSIKDTKAKIRRNDPCYCGSDKKYKHCHGSSEA